MELRLAHPEAVVIAGGSDVLIKLREGKMPGAELISIRDIAPLRGVSMDAAGTLKIGPLTTFSELTADALIREHVPTLGQAADEVGSPQIRNIGTVGGNICNGVTSADTAPTLFAFDAEVELTGTEGARRIAIADFYLGPGRHRRAADRHIHPARELGAHSRTLHQIFHAHGAGHRDAGLLRECPPHAGPREHRARAHSLRRGRAGALPLPGGGGRLRRRALHGRDGPRLCQGRSGGDKPARLLARQ